MPCGLTALSPAWKGARDGGGPPLSAFALIREDGGGCVEGVGGGIVTPPLSPKHI